MKEVIIILGNMASGKSSAAKLLAEKLPEFTYVCQDDFRNAQTERYLEVDNRIFEEEIAQQTKHALERYPKIIYESTGATRFFREAYYSFLVQQRKIFVVRLNCSDAVCYRRFLKRRQEGKNHLVPIFNKSKSPWEIIGDFRKKSAWLKHDLLIDSEKNTSEQIVSSILAHLPADAPVQSVERLLHNWNYDQALQWFIANVPGKKFLKDMLSKSKDQFNTLKLKKELNLYLNAIQEAEKQKDHLPEVRKVFKVKPKKSLDLQEEVEGLVDEVREEVEEIKDQLENLREHLSNAPSKVELKDEDDLDEKWKPLYKEANHFFSLIDFEEDAEQRKKIAFHILDLMDEVQKVWEAKDFKNKHGQLPNFQSQGIEQLTIEQMVRRVNTLRTYISKANKGKLNKDRIPDWEAEIKELERRIKG